jgi:thiol:disulfide interchange protein DsbG
MNRRQFGSAASAIALASLLAIGLAGCGQDAPPPAPPAPALSAAQMVDKAATADGFAVGPMMAANTAYIFFDTACPHCAAVWLAAKPLAGKIRIVWIPVGFLSKMSGPRGAAILGAADPARAMEANETKMLNGEQGADITTPANDAAEQKVAANTDMLKSFGADGVPLILFKNAKTGEYGAQAGQLNTAELTTLFGL